MEMLQLLLFELLMVIAASSAQTVDGNVTATSAKDFDGSVAVLHHMVTAMQQLIVQKTLTTVLLCYNSLTLLKT
jgi:hypothetical protein